jgi:hypothetical protein
VCADQDVERPDHIHFVRIEGLLHRTLHTREGGVVKNEVRLLGFLLEFHQIADIALDDAQVLVLLDLLEVGLPAGREVVENHHPVTLFDEPVCDVRPDEPRAPSDQVSRHLSHTSCERRISTILPAA